MVDRNRAHARIGAWSCAAMAMAGLSLGTAGSRADQSRTPSFTKDVAPIVYRHCAVCHRLGGSAPFSLITYREVKDRASLVLRAVEQRSMPPWLPDPGFGQFAGERRLSDDAIATIRQWVEAGAPEGDPSELPPSPDWPTGWQLGEPDLVVRFPSFSLPSHGTDVYRNLVTAIPVSARRYVRTVEVRPGDPRVVHHARMMIDSTPSSRRYDERDPGPGFDGMDLKSSAHNPNGFFVGWTPGKTPYRGTDDMAWRVDPGTDLVLQLHLRPTGQSETIAPQVGLYFAARPPQRQPVLVMLGSFDIDIPAGKSDYVVTDRFELPVAVDVLSIYPHAHYLATEMQGVATLPSGRRVWLFRIRDWDFNWQDEYRYAQTISLPAGTALSMQYTYDNSAANPQNPNAPPQRVVYGSRSSDEMADLVIQVVPRSRTEVVTLEQALNWKYRVQEADYLARVAVARGNELAASGNDAEALEAYRESLRHRGDDSRVLTKMAQALIRLDDPEGAVFIAERAAQSADDADARVLDDLAGVYAAAGRLDAAARTATRAAGLAAAAGLDSLAREIHRRIEQYERMKRP